MHVIQLYVNQTRTCKKTPKFFSGMVAVISFVCNDSLLRDWSEISRGEGEGVEILN